LRDLAPIQFRESPASVLGEAFQALIGPRFRGDKGQFFTPRTLVRAMIQVVNPKLRDKIVDPAAGTGGFLVETHIHRKKTHPRTQNFGRLLGIDKDRDLQRLGGAMVTIATDGIGSIQLANSLDLKNLPTDGDCSPFGANVVLTNPPFGAKIGIKEEVILNQFALGHAWVYSASDNAWHKQDALRSSQDPQILFLELCLRLLKPGGLCGIVLPEGVFGNKNTGYVWDFVRSMGTIEAMIDCPRTTFQPGTDTKTNVVFIRRSNGQDCVSDGSVNVAVAKYCGHDRRGKTARPDGRPVQNDFEAIGVSYESLDDEWWSPCTLSDPYYVVPRFYSKTAHNKVTREAREWLGELATVDELIGAGGLVVRKGHEVGADAYGSGEIPFVRTSDIANWEVSLNPTNGVSEEVYEKYRGAQRLQAGDVLLVVDGRYKIGRSAILHEHNCRSVAQSHLRILTATKECPLGPYELLYVLNLPSVLEEMRNLVFIQSTLGSIGKRLGRLLLPIPTKTNDWKKRIREFRALLDTRAHSLEELRRFQTPEPEL
ncbi:MAG: N-6 DNA methylase, partial [Planctomycetes bacterium]|nr:N-6 DNA methylase [Planctomycetota bacterium]